MMWFKRKKEAPVPPVQPHVCNHKYRDFDWYGDAKYFTDTDSFAIGIYEPYVCVLCKHREDKLLTQVNGRGYKNFIKQIDRLEDLYPKIRHRADVEDEINDMLMLDPYYLDAYYKLYPEKRRLTNDA